jgi:DMSO reductase anchor subunit
LAIAVGVAGVGASGRLYVVPGRPAWHSPLTIVRFYATAATLGPLLTGHPRWALVGLALQVTATVGNLVRLQLGARAEGRASVHLLLGWFRAGALALVVLAVVGAVTAAGGVVLVALPALALAELLGRYLFFVTVVPLDMPGSFTSRTRA